MIICNDPLFEELEPQTVFSVFVDRIVVVRDFYISILSLFFFFFWNGTGITLLS